MTDLAPDFVGPAPRARNFRAPKWPQERVDRIAALLKEGMTATQVAAELGDGLSRNAIIGICRRRGIALNGRPGDNMRKVPREPRQRRARFAKRMFPDLPAVPLPAAPVSRAEPMGLYRRKLLDLRNESCRFPVTAEPPHRFCGEPTADFKGGVPYCPYHARMAYRRPGEVEAA